MLSAYARSVGRASIRLIRFLQLEGRDGRFSVQQEFEESAKKLLSLHSQGENNDQHYNAFLGKKALVVGGTKGIGRSIAKVLAFSGAEETVIVGRDEKAYQSLQEELKNKKLSFVNADLSSTKKVDEFLSKLNENRGSSGKSVGEKFDIVVLTVGCWPDLTGQTPGVTEDGLDRVFQIDIVTRYQIMSSLLGFNKSERSLLNDRAIVLSVLSSPAKCPSAIPFRSLSTDGKRCTFFDDVADGMYSPDRYLLRCFTTVGVCHDLMLEVAARRGARDGKKVCFVGTFPGIVETEVGIPYLGARLAALNFRILGYLGMSKTPEMAGANHSAILDVVGKKFEDFSDISKEDGRNDESSKSLKEDILSQKAFYFDDVGVARQASSVILSPNMHDWFSQKMEKIIGKK